MTRGEIRKNGLALLGLTLVGCQEARRPSLEYVSGEEIGQWIETLSSDEFEGRGPSSPGEEKTINYLRDQFRAIGLNPGNGDDYFQEVPLVEMTVDNEPRLRIGGADTTRTLAFGDEAVLWTKRVVEQSQLWRSDLVFVGYGIVAPAPLCPPDQEVGDEVSCQAVDAPSSPDARLVSPTPEPSVAALGLDDEVRLTYRELTALIADAVNQLR